MLAKFAFDALCNLWLMVIYMLVLGMKRSLQFQISQLIVPLDFTLLLV